MKKILFAILTTTLFGCYKEPQSVEHTGKGDSFEIEYLFEKNGVKMYRFYDGGLYHYFTTTGETITEQSTGKTSYEEKIKSKYHMSDSEYHAIAELPGHETKCTKSEKE